MEEKTTSKLNSTLKKTRPEDIAKYLAANSINLVENKSFSSYIRELLQRKAILQQQVFIRADIPERYGYKIISLQKRTRQKDVILRICLGGCFTLEETQKALKLYGMSELYPRIARDAVLIVAFNNGIYDIIDVNKMLEEHGFEALRSCGEL